MSEELSEMVHLADEYYDKTNGLFDIVDGEGKLDFGGFAKGYFLKKCEEMLRSKDVSCAFVDLLAVQGTLKSLLQHHSSKASMLWHSAFFTVQLLTSTCDH